MNDLVGAGLVSVWKSFFDVSLDCFTVAINRHELSLLIALLSSVVSFVLFLIVGIRDYFNLSDNRRRTHCHRSVEHIVR